MTSEPLAALVLAAALLINRGTAASGRLHDLVVAPVGTPTPRRTHREIDAVGPLVRVAGSVGLGLLVWAFSGAAAVGALVAGIGLAWPVVLTGLAARTAHVDDPVELAATWAELAVCLEAGLPVAAAVSAAAEPLDGITGATLRRIAGLLELGGDPAQAWQTAQGDPATAAFARAAGRSAATGAALARTARAESARVREALTDVAEARAQRAGVLIAAPLGLCFLPAFLVLGVVPVVIGLAGEVLVPW